MLNYVYVAIGSAVGGVARYAIGGWAQERFGRPGADAFPVGTLLVNVTGSLVLGVLIVVIARAEGHASAARLLLAVGLCGGYTTFSTFSAETLGLFERGAPAAALLNVLLSMGLALAATFGGGLLARALLGRP